MTNDLPDVSRRCSRCAPHTVAYLLPDRDECPSSWCLNHKGPSLSVPIVLPPGVMGWVDAVRPTIEYRACRVATEDFSAHGVAWRRVA